MASWAAGQGVYRPQADANVHDAPLERQSAIAASLCDGSSLRWRAFATAKLCDGTYTVLNKDSVRAVLRSLNMQLYIEKWLQIIQRVTGIEPPSPGGQLLMSLDACFMELHPTHSLTRRTPKSPNASDNATSTSVISVFELPTPRRV